MTRYDLATPTLLADLDIMERNLHRMGAWAAENGIGLRPHVKTHKSPFVAAQQIRHGAIGLTCATPREAEVMAAVSHDLLMAYPPVGGDRARRVAELPPQVRPLVGLDSLEAISSIGTAALEAGRTIRVLVELDLGMGRVGVASPDEAVGLARQVDQHEALEFAGVMFYPGHLRSAGPERAAGLARLSRDLDERLAVLGGAGLDPAIVSGGSTPTAWESHLVRGMTEFRPGTYVYNDRSTVVAAACDREDCALTVLATVVSTAVAGQAVIDAGSKALARDPRSGDPGAGFGELLEHPEVVVRAMSEEHGILDLSRTSWRPRVGEQVQVIPDHACVAVHLHEQVHGVRAGALETTWTVEARGRLPGQGPLVSPSLHHPGLSSGHYA